MLNARGSKVKFFWIEDSGKYDEALPFYLPAVKGTMKLHQINSRKAGKIHHCDVFLFT